MFVTRGYKSIHHQKTSIYAIIDFLLIKNIHFGSAFKFFFYYLAHKKKIIYDGILTS